MHDGAVWRQWTAEEDSLLIQAVTLHGEVDNWKKVALCVPGRTNKACRKRWLHSLSPEVKKSAWTAEEDQLLRSLYAEHGSKWSVIARRIAGRTDDACSKRYREALDPALRREEWTAEEDDQLQAMYARVGGKWGQIGLQLRRSGLSCRNRWRMLDRRKASKARREQLNVILADAINNEQPSGRTSAEWAAQEVDQSTWGEATPDFASALPDDSIMPMLQLQQPYIAPEEFSAPDTSYDTAGVSQAVTHLSFMYTSSSLSGALSSPLPSSSPRAQCAPRPFPMSEPVNMTEGFSEHSSNGDGHVSTAFVASNDFVSVDYNDGRYYQDILPTTAEVAHSVLCDNYSSVSIGGSPEARSAMLTPVSSVVSLSPTASSSSLLAPSPLPASLSAARYVELPPIAFLAESDTAASEPPSPLGKQKEREISEEDRNWQSLSRKRPPLRLSSSLPAVEDSDILAYCCGHPDCWPEGVPVGLFCFATSRELLEHNKTSHPYDQFGLKPFRCGLAGCGKSWKNINGLQYHLQISKTHFQQALATTLPSFNNTRSVVVFQQTGGREQIKANARRLYPCPYPGCRNQYKQHSGLRYHLAHGHPTDMPAQLDVVPPALARHMQAKMQNLSARSAASIASLKFSDNRPL